MRNGQNSACLELLANGRLNDCICFHIDVGRGFVEDQHLIATKESPCETNELLLPDGEQRASVRYFCVQAIATAL